MQEKSLISEVYNEDCVQGMKRFPDKFFDLAIVDPPYGINADNMSMGSNPNRSRNDGYGSSPSISTAKKLKGRLNSGSGKLKNRILNKSEIGWDNQIPSAEYFTELFRISKEQIIFGGNYFPLPPTRGIGCWDKMQPWENFSQWEMICTSFDCPSFKVTYSNTGGANAEKKIHPTQKPIYVYRYLLKKFAKPGFKILDTHMGSQSSRIASYNMGFDYWGFEIDRDYFERGNNRFSEHKKQLQLFA